MGKFIYTAEEAANILCIHKQTLLRLIKLGKIKAANVGVGKRNIWRISEANIQSFLDGQQKNGSS